MGWSYFRQSKTLDDGDVPKFRVVKTNDSETNQTQGFDSNFVRTNKYTSYNFIPKNLFEQFQRIANVYFLIISLLQIFTDLSPTGKYTTAGPLALILTVTAIKEAVEDYKRYKSDVAVNNTKVEVMRLHEDKSPYWETTAWKNIVVGDIVNVTNKSNLPADIIALSTSEPLGMCYIETANLDGETNLKIRQSLPETQELDTIEKLSEFKATLHCELPNNRLYNFDGYFELDEMDEDQNAVQLPLQPKQILLRGSQLRNTTQVFGLVVFTGHETKVMMNSSKSVHKRTDIERKTNLYIVLIFSLLTFLCLIGAIVGGSWADPKLDDAFYLPASVGGASYAESFGTFLILLNNLVPISLYVTVEFVKRFQANFIDYDLDMYYDVGEKFAEARTSNLNEELGQVEYIFSDKTGTLTCNLMEFRKCTIAGIAYGRGTTEIGRAAAARTGKKIEVSEEDNLKVKPDPMFNFVDPNFATNLAGHKTAPSMVEFLRLLSVCHTVIPETREDNPGVIEYQAASPDEAALVAAGKCLGYRFAERTPKTVTIYIKDGDKERPETYEILNVLEFNSTRKRMSVICRNPQGKIILYCKGADTVIYERLAKKGNTYGDVTLKHLETYASEGLRTLCCASVELDEAAWQKWNKECFEAASISLEDREQKLDDAAELIEKDLVLIGATAIEDKLQEGVPDTIATLADASIKIWVLTGDKQETAINIGFACALLNDDMTLLILNESTKAKTERALQRVWREYDALSEKSREEVGLIVDGATLHFILDAEEQEGEEAGLVSSSPQDGMKSPLAMSFLSLGKRCKAVICCRVSPLQKAQVTSLVKVNEGKITLGIGDGANDCSMIKAAHVGVGISGMEGLQAVQASDYAIAQFKYLKKLLLVHGHWSYRRVGRVIVYSFYKNVLLYMTQFWFAMFNLMSGQTLYEKWTQASYNVIFTSLPVIVLGVLDKDVLQKTLYFFPKLYEVGHRKELFNLNVFASWVSSAIWHSLVAFFIGMFTFGLTSEIPAADGQMGGNWAMGVYVYTSVICIVTFKMMLISKSFTLRQHIVNWGSLIVWFIFQIVYSNMPKYGPEVTGLANHVFSYASFWLVFILATAVALTRDFLWLGYKNEYKPNTVSIAREIESLDAYTTLGADLAGNNRRSELTPAPVTSASSVEARREVNRSVRRSESGVGFAFSQESGQADYVKQISTAKSKRKPKSTKKQSDSVQPSHVNIENDSL